VVGGKKIPGESPILDLAMILTMAAAAPKNVDNFIAGASKPPSTNDRLDVTSPADGTVIGRVALSGPADVDAAVTAAQAACKYSTFDSNALARRNLHCFRIHHVSEKRKIQACLLNAPRIVLGSS
jgi:acyl-CoA reductase-like NAD-dependent aldehyde dehydrogenase